MSSDSAAAPSRVIVIPNFAVELGERIRLVADDRHNSQLEAGEIISTGTLTRALPIRPGETWRTELTGLSLEVIRLALT